MSDIQDIKRIADHRSQSQAGLNSRNKLKYSKYRASPYEHPAIQKTIQFSQRPKMPLTKLDDA